MQISLTRSQHQETDRKGRVKGTEFRLDYQLRVTDEERSLIERYDLGERLVVGKYDSPPDLRHTINRLLEGSSVVRDTTDNVLQFEQLVMKGGRNAAALVSQLSAFNGTEQIVDLNPTEESSD
jgi:hypothetical protein